jgi:hypothetical protein
VVIWYNVWQFGIVRGRWVYFFPFWYVWTKKILATMVGIAKSTKNNTTHARQLMYGRDGCVCTYMHEHCMSWVGHFALRLVDTNNGILVVRCRVTPRNQRWDQS